MRRQTITGNVAYCRSKGIGITAAFNEKQMFTNYSSAEQRLSSPYFGNTVVRHSTVNYEK